MLEQIKSLLIFQIKKIEFKFQTWRNQREINKAFHGTNGNRALILFSIAGGIGLVGLTIFYFSVYFPGENKDKKPASIQITRTQSDSGAKRLKKGSERQPQTSSKQQHSDSVTQKAVVSIKESVPDTFVSLFNTQEPIPEVTQDAQQKYLESIIWMPKEEMTEILIANKADSLLYFYELTAGGEWVITREFNIATGENPGKKEREGDKRTPEGTYFIVGRKEKRELSNIYGPLVYILNYPNRLDRKAGRTGDGIWIHGTSPDSIPISTRGCIELNNTDIVILSDFLKKGIGTPVVIMNHLNVINPIEKLNLESLRSERTVIIETYHATQLKFASFLNNWRQAWALQDMSLFKMFYDTTVFTGQSRDWEAWRVGKESTFRRYKTINVAVDNVWVSEFCRDSASVRFVQYYTTDLTHMKHYKMLDFKVTDNRWRIKMEKTYSRKELLL